MPKHLPHPEFDPHTMPDLENATPPEPPLSRRERRGKSGKQQQASTGKIHGTGRLAIPPAKHQNYRRG
ncbi:hypothetical protein [Nocardia inohanensis]|uniref:hypothetical protein n=1 Tax=Nocardia inohanensis TaxID=209246 RepID=UPI000AD69E11|nr:hypothetical protein [Nocardia inohanensis]